MDQEMYLHKHQAPGTTKFPVATFVEEGAPFEDTFRGVCCKGHTRRWKCPWRQIFVRWFLKFMSKVPRRFLQLKTNVFICFRSDKSIYFHLRNWLIFRVPNPRQYLRDVASEQALWHSDKIKKCFFNFCEIFLLGRIYSPSVAWRQNFTRPTVHLGRTSSQNFRKRPTLWVWGVSKVSRIRHLSSMSLTHLVLLRDEVLVHVLVFYSRDLPLQHFSMLRGWSAGDFLLCCSDSRLAWRPPYNIWRPSAIWHRLNVNICCMPLLDLQPALRRLHCGPCRTWSVTTSTSENVYKKHFTSLTGLPVWVLCQGTTSLANLLFQYFFYSSLLLCSTSVLCEALSSPRKKVTVLSPQIEYRTQ